MLCCDLRKERRGDERRVETLQQPSRPASHWRHVTFLLQSLSETIASDGANVSLPIWVMVSDRPIEMRFYCIDYAEEDFFLQNDARLLKKQRSVDIDDYNGVTNSFSTKSYILLRS